MIDAAVSVFPESIADSRWLNYGGAGPVAAAIAYQAKLIEYPDMQSIIWQVIASCRSGSEDTRDRISTTISTARILALTDKVAARELLRLVDKNQDQIPRGKHGVSLYDQYLQAWTLVDFGRGTALIREDLERLEQAGADANFRSGQGEVFRLLVAPPEERFHILFQGTALWELVEDGSEQPW